MCLLVKVNNLNLEAGELKYLRSVKVDLRNHKTVICKNTQTLRSSLLKADLFEASRPERMLLVGAVEEKLL